MQNLWKNLEKTIYLHEQNTVFCRIRPVKAVGLASAVSVRAARFQASVRWVGSDGSLVGQRSFAGKAGEEALQARAAFRFADWVKKRIFAPAMCMRELCT